jgi:hypothetical protein
MTDYFDMNDRHPRQVAEELDEANIYVWDGNYYALAVTERLGLEDSGGMMRVGPVHYNTLEEIRQFGEVLRRITEMKVDVCYPAGLHSRSDILPIPCYFHLPTSHGTHDVEKIQEKCEYVCKRPIDHPFFA